MFPFRRRGKLLWLLVYSTVTLRPLTGFKGRRDAPYNPTLRYRVFNIPTVPCEGLIFTDPPLHCNSTHFFFKALGKSAPPETGSGPNAAPELSASMEPNPALIKLNAMRTRREGKAENAGFLTIFCSGLSGTNRALASAKSRCDHKMRTVRHRYRLEFN